MQGNFKTPMGYRDLAQGLYDMSFGAIDVRPEALQHFSKGYFGYGPLRAFDASFQDLAEQTGGTRERRAEQFGPLSSLAALTGFGTIVDNQSLKAEVRSYSIQDKAYNKLATYGIEQTDPNNGPGDRINTIIGKLMKQNPDPNDVQLIRNTLEFTDARKALEKQYAEAAKAYNEKVAKGIPADPAQMQLLQLRIDMLTEKFVQENNEYD